MDLTVQRQYVYIYFFVCCINGKHFIMKSIHNLLNQKQTQQLLSILQ